MCLYSYRDRQKHIGPDRVHDLRTGFRLYNDGLICILRVFIINQTVTSVLEGRVYPLPPTDRVYFIFYISLYISLCKNQGN